MNKYDIFSKRLKELRSDMKLTQKQFAEKVGFTQATLSAYENNPKNPSFDIIIDIAEKCNVSIDWLCGLSDKKNTNEEIKTYSDIIKFLIKLSNMYNLDLIVDGCDFVAFTAFADRMLIGFLNDWHKIKDLYDKNIITDDMYSPWIESKMKEYDILINKEEYCDSHNLSTAKEIIDNFIKDFCEEH